MFRYNNQSKEKGFNDYVVDTPDGRMTEIYHGRSVSSKSVYSQNGSLSRKKLTVVSRDGISPEFKGDYCMTQNGAFMNSQNRKISYVPITVNQSPRNSSQNKLQHYESLRNSIIKSKLQRPISPSSMSPTNVLRLKKSISIEKNQQVTSSNRMNDPQQQYSADRTLNIKNFQNRFVPPIKIHPQNSHRSIFSPRNDIPSCEQPSRQSSLGTIESIRKQLLSIFNLKVLELQSRMQYQQETIKSLSNKISQNNRKLKEKERVIDELLRIDRERTKSLFNINEKHVKKREIGGGNEGYLLKRIKDIQSKFLILLKEDQQFKTFQKMIDQKLAKFQHEMITLNSSKLNGLKNQLDLFLQQKSYTLQKLNESIIYLDKRLIGRTQAIKELLCELKQRVKQVEDSWTQKETKTTKQSITLELRQNESISVDEITSARLISTKLKQPTTTGNNKSTVINSQVALQSSLEFSVTSYEADDQNRLSGTKNIYCDYNEMSDLSVGLENSLKNDCSKLTDEFYYPGGVGQQKRDTLRDISPIVNKRQQKENNENVECKEQYYGEWVCKNKGDSKKTFQLKSNPSSPPYTTRTTLNNINPTHSSSNSQVTIKITNDSINKKIQCIQELIQTKRLILNQELQQGQLRCYIDKTGYLKYTDSRTFVFDKKGNLITCTEGEFQFFVAKGLIHSQKDEQERNTVSYISPGL